MSASTAIGMVSTSLRSLLVGEMRLNPSVDVTLLAPDESGSNRRINLFLFKVEENAFLKNQDWMAKPGNASQITPPPLSLCLYYLMTSYAQNDAQTGNAGAHQIFGEAMRVFYENAIIPDNFLDAGLKDAREQLSIVLRAPEDPEEITRIWSALTKPYRLSVIYQVSTVQLDMMPARERPMPRRVRKVGVPGVRAPFLPPVVTDLAPASGAVGSTVTFTGQNLPGWRASVSMGGEDLLQGQELANNTFTATIPAALQPGFYDLRVDISRMFRRTFLFEVTP